MPTVQSTKDATTAPNIRCIGRESSQVAASHCVVMPTQYSKHQGISRRFDLPIFPRRDPWLAIRPRQPSAIGGGICLTCIQSNGIAKSHNPHLDEISQKVQKLVRRGRSGAALYLARTCRSKGHKGA
jgi:hypothetical protein